MVLENVFPPDIRVEKEAAALTEAGHTVHLLAFDFTDQPAEERVGPLTVHRVRFPREGYRKLHPTVVRWPLYAWLWARWIRRFIGQVRPDVLTLHDLPLARAVLTVGQEVDLPVVLDLHENFPAAIQSWGFTTGPLGRYFYDLDRWLRYERWATTTAAGVIVVVEEALDRLSEYGVDPHRRAVVMNAERRDFADGVTPVDAGGGPPLRLLYIGGFGPHRGLDTAIRALAEDAAPSASRLRLVGAGRIRADLEALSRSLGLDERVEFEDWVPAEQVPREIGNVHIGLVPQRRSLHTETTIPHKLFQYMLLGRPVIVSDCRPLARVVRAAGAGRVFPSDDPGALARAMAELADGDLRRALGAAGRGAALGPLSWEREATHLVELYDRVLAGSRA